MVTTTDLPQEREKGARWMARVHTWLAPAVHEEGREPYPALMIQGRVGGGGTYIVGLEGLR